MSNAALTVRGHVPLAKALYKFGLHDKFDLASAHELRLDHSLVVPLHFLNPSMEVPVVPIYTNGFASPLPLATRFLGPDGAALCPCMGRQRASGADRQRLFRHGRRWAAPGGPDGSGRKQSPVYC